MTKGRLLLWSITSALAGFLFGVAGVIGAIRLGQGQIAIGDDKMFPAQAAVVVGGTSLAGGKGGVVNTIVGVLIMTVLDNGLVMQIGRASCRERV